MTPYTKIKVANALVLLGSGLIALSFYRFLSLVSPSPHRMSLLGDGLLTLGGFVGSALIIGLSGFVWSLIVEKRNPSARVPGTYAIRIAALVVLFVPLVVSGL